MDAPAVVGAIARRARIRVRVCVCVHVYARTSSRAEIDTIVIERCSEYTRRAANERTHDDDGDEDDDDEDDGATTRRGARGTRGASEWACGFRGTHDIR